MSSTSIRKLNNQLGEMLRISQRSVDYATKAYASGRAEFAQQAQHERQELDKVVHKIFASTAGSYEDKEADDTQMSYREVVRSISLALLTTCRYAHEVSLHAAALTRNGVFQRSHDVLRMGERVNGLMRLCIVAVMNKDPEHAKTVLRNIDNCNFDFAGKTRKESAAGSIALPGHFQERIIANSFQRMIENVRTIASVVACYCHSLKRISAVGQSHGILQAS
jgi:hypothetical protein